MTDHVEPPINVSPYEQEKDWERISMCRQMALAQACRDHKGEYHVAETINLAESYENYLYGGAAYARGLLSMGERAAVGLE